MDETKPLSEIHGSQPLAEGSSGASPETKAFSETGGSRAPAPGSDAFAAADPSTIGRYRVLQRLGQGGFGRVYLAHDDDLDRPVAIKVPNPARINHPDDVELFLREARVLARLDHPSIVPVFDVAAVSTQPGSTLESATSRHSINSYGTISGLPPAGSCGTWKSGWWKVRTAALVDLFDPRHAHKVLTALGRAYGALPARFGEQSGDQNSFLDQSISGIAQDGKVIPVRLALFAEMVKGKPWVPMTLREVGGTEPITLATTPTGSPSCSWLLIRRPISTCFLSSSGAQSRQSRFSRPSSPGRPLFPGTIRRSIRPGPRPIRPPCARSSRHRACLPSDSLSARPCLWLSSSRPPRPSASRDTALSGSVPIAMGRWCELPRSGPVMAEPGESLQVRLRKRSGNRTSGTRKISSCPSMWLDTS